MVSVGRSEFARRPRAAGDAPVPRDTPRTPAARDTPAPHARPRKRSGDPALGRGGGGTPAPGGGGGPPAPAASVGCGPSSARTQRSAPRPPPSGRTASGGAVCSRPARLCERSTRLQMANLRSGRVTHGVTGAKNGGRDPLSSSSEDKQSPHKSA